MQEALLLSGTGLPANREIANRRLVRFRGWSCPGCVRRGIIWGLPFQTRPCGRLFADEGTYDVSFSGLGLSAVSALLVMFESTSW